MTALARQPVDAPRVSAIVLRPAPVPAAVTFLPVTIEAAVWLVGELSWTQGVDEMTQIRGLVRDLTDDHWLIDRGVRDDDFIRARATATLRRLSAKFIRDDKAGLVQYGQIDPAALACPDFLDFLSK